MFSSVSCRSRNVPVPEISDAEQAVIDKKVQEIERGKQVDDVDEDDAGKRTNEIECDTLDTELLVGVKRPSEYQNDDGGNSNARNNRSHRGDFSYDGDYSHK